MDLRVFFPETASQGEEVFHEIITSFTENTLRVVLHSLQGIFAMSDTHDDTRFLRNGRHREVCGECFIGCTQGVITDGRQALWNTSKTSAIVVTYPTDFTVHDFTGIPVEPQISDKDTIGVIMIRKRRCGRKYKAYPIEPPKRSTRHSNPIQTPRTGTLPAKYLMASLEIPESVCG